MTGTIEIDGRKIGDGQAPYIVAEMSANHNGDIETAFEIIRKAKVNGADAVKIQTYTADTITLKSDLPDFQINEGLWEGRTLYELYEWAHTPWEWHKPLFEEAREIGITIFSSPFDTTAVDLLEDLNAPAYKIASFEAVDLALIDYVARTKKPIIISTGMADAEEIEEAVDTVRSAGADKPLLLHCVSGYPAPAKDYNLKTLVDMKHRFQTIVGLSDHTLDNATAIASVALGACFIEKHFTLDRKAGGPDDSFSLEPIDLQNLCNGTKMAWNAMGKIDYGRKSSEHDNVKFRRSLYAVNDIKSGSIISKDDVRSVRPGFGLPPKFLPRVIGSRARIDIDKHQPIKWDDLDI